MPMTGPGRRTGQDPDFLRCLDRLADRALAELGIVVTMVSGFRLASEQAHLRWGWEMRQKYPNDPRYQGFNFAAKVGESAHESGYAADIDPDLAEDPRLRPIAEECGLYLSVRWPDGRVREWWHLSPAWMHGGKRPVWLDAPATSPNVPQPEDDDMDQLYRMAETGEMFLVADGRRRPVLAGIEAELAKSGQIKSATATEIPKGKRDAFLALFPDALEK